MKARFVGLLGGLLVCTATASQADPVTVTSGYVSSDFTVTTVDIFTNTFSVNVLGGFILKEPNLGAIFNVGQVADFSSTLNGNLVNVGQVIGPPPGSTVINGISYPHAADVLATANLVFSAAPVRVSGFNTTMTPFTMTGSLQVFKNVGTTSVPIQGDSLLSTSLTGSGILNAAGDSGGPIFTFSTATPSATPEPASLLLLGSGLLGIALRRSRRI